MLGDSSVSWWRSHPYTPAHAQGIVFSSPYPPKTGLSEGELCPPLLFPTAAPSVALPLIKQQQWPRQPHRVLELLLIGVLSSLRPTGPVVTHGKGTGQGGEA